MQRAPLTLHEIFKHMQVNMIYRPRMSRIVYVNGAYLPEQEAKVSIFDRGYVFADGIYEVASVLDGRLIDSARHRWRLEKSLTELSIAMPMPWEEIEHMERELVRRNNIDQGMVYFQVTRGVADREFHYKSDTPPTLTAFTQARQLDPHPLEGCGVTVITCPDLRWKRRDIKSISLLAQVMAKQTAQAAGAYEAVMVEDGFVTEGASSSVFIIDQHGHLIVRPGGGTDILPGLTRQAMLELAADTHIDIRERAFTPEELYQAREAFLTSATAFVMPIVAADGKQIATGKPGPIAMKLRKLFIALARA